MIFLIVHCLSSSFIFCKTSSKEFVSSQQIHQFCKGIVSSQFIRLTSMFILQTSFIITSVFSGKFWLKLFIRVVFPEPSAPKNK